MIDALTWTWAAVTILGLIPTVIELIRSVRAWLLVRDMTLDPSLRDVAQEELIRELIIFGGQVLALAVAVVAIGFPGRDWTRTVAIWLLIPLPAVLGLLSIHGANARRRSERRLR